MYLFLSLITSNPSFHQQIGTSKLILLMFSKINKSCDPNAEY